MTKFQKSKKYRECPKNHVCQFSLIVKKKICCTKFKYKLSGNTSIQKRRVYCEKGLPLLVNGSPQTCATTVCSSMYKCKYSTAYRNYYCCSKEDAGNVKINVVKILVFPGPHGCPYGLALLFPSTGEPVKCTATSIMKACPPHYNCVKNVMTSIFQCCSKEDQHKILKKQHSRKISKGQKGSSLKVYKRNFGNEFSSRSSRSKQF